MKLSIENQLNNIIVKVDTFYFKESKKIEKIFYYDKENALIKSVNFYKNEDKHIWLKINSDLNETSISINYDSLGTIKKFEFEIDKTNISLSYHKNGSVKNYYTGKGSYYTGYEVSYCENGQKELEHFYDSLSYTQQAFYCDGSLKFKGVVINHKDEEGNFLKELPDGKWVFWHKNGKIKKEIYFEKSKILKTLKYDDEGVMYFEKEEKQPVGVLFHEGYVLGELGEIYN